MKRKLLYAAGFIMLTCSFNACELLGGNCKTCQTVSYENDYPIAYGNESQFCDEELLAIKAIPPSTSGGVTTQWECY
ncbi:MAG TPA: hypothetical protein VMV74_04290 [Bacteroidales bacterium]|nr:hypothetical protein [Bacteroidales bacterium]